MLALMLTPTAYHNQLLNAPNVWQVPLPAQALQRACTIWDDALAPHMVIHM